MIVGDAASSRVVATPQDGKVSWTTHDDLAAAAAQVLTHEGRFDGPTPPLTASEALDFDDVASILTDLHGRLIKHETVADKDEEARMAADGALPGVIGITLGMYRAARAGEFAAVDPTLEQLLGRPPIRLEHMLAEYRNARR